MIVLAAHATYSNGKLYEAPANTIVETLIENGSDFLYIRHSIDGRLKTKIFLYENGRIKQERNLLTLSYPPVVRYITEVISTTFYLTFILKRKGICYIGLDPLNAFVGILVKKLGFAKKIIFYTADYSKKRFGNKILNKLYLSMDRFCVFNSDETWNVSTRIMEVRKKMGLEDNRNIFVPNVPSEIYKKYIELKKNRYHLICLGIIDKQMDYVNLFDAIIELKEKYPKILVKIVGTGPKEKEYKDYVKSKKLDKHIIFLGHLTHEKALQEIARSGIGLALYNGLWNFNYYGDSMKCREYFCYGLPVITTNTHSTADEIRDSEAGIVCEANKQGYVNAFETIISKYETYSNNSRKLAEKYDAIHKKLIEKLIC